MAFLKVENVSIRGVACAVPKDVKEIKELPFFAPGEAEKVIALTHVERSRMVPKGMCCSDLCQAAAEKLLDSLGWERETVEALIFVSLSRDYIAPATANILQEKLHLPKSCMAFDIPLACSGYVYGLSVISSLMSSGNIKRALLLVGETTSVLQSPLDKTLWPLHGDAGSATALEYEEGVAPMFFNLMSNGAGADSIINQYGGTRYPMDKEGLEMKEREPGIIRNGLHAYMDGMNVFSFSVKEPPAAIKALCEYNGIDLNSIDYLLLHQANKYMDEKIGKKLKIPSEKIPYSLMQYGNTSSTSIPMTIVVGIGDKLSQEQADVIMCGFGAGLSWAAAYIKLNHIVSLPLIELG